MDPIWGQVQDSQFYKYDLKVILGNPSKHFLRESFSPFFITPHITRNNQGTWSGYTVIQPSSMNKFIDVTQMEVIVDKNDYLRVENHINRFTMQFFATGGVSVQPGIY